MEHLTIFLQRDVLLCHKIDGIRAYPYIQLYIATKYGTVCTLTKLTYGVFLHLTAGTFPYGTSTELSLFHTQELYVTVVSWNHAGMETVVYGGPYVVDLAPPELREGGSVKDGGWGEEDRDYQSTAVLESDWSDIVDSESEIMGCVFSIGKFYCMFHS